MRTESKELVHRALSHEPVDRVPHMIEFTVPAQDRFSETEQGRRLLDMLDNDIVKTPVIRVEWGLRGPDGTYTDEFGQVWDRRVDPDIGVPVPFLTHENTTDFRWPDPREEGRFDELARNCREHPDKFQMMCLDFSLFERAWGMRGMENLMVDFLLAPEYAERLLDRILDFNLRIIELGLKRCPDVDGVYFGDDYGSQGGLLTGPELWRRFLKPRLARQYAAVKAAGKKVAIHSCGEVQEILPDLVEIGVDCFNPFQPEVMNVEEVYGRYHGRLAFWGGVSIQHLLPYGTECEVESRIGDLLTMGRSGGYIIAPAHSIPKDARTANIAAMITMILDQNKNGR